MHYRELLLFLFKKLEHERSVNAVFHLLKGKKSAQTLQDAYLFQIENFYGIDRKLKKPTFDVYVRELTENRLVRVENDQAIVTEQGNQILRGRNFQSYYQIKGHKYHQIDREFKQGLILLIQTVSMLIHGENKFIPIVDQPYIQSRVREVLRDYSMQFDMIAEQLYGELHTALSTIDEHLATVLLKQCSGYARVGMSEQQIAVEENRNKEDLHLQTVAAIHNILDTITEQTEQYTLLTKLILKKTNRLTVSAQETFDFYQAGHTLEEIALIRQLKISTIQDHFVEIATHKKVFNIYSFISKQHLDEIQEAIQNTSTRKLKPIKEQLREEIDYFHIRLAIANMNDDKE
ncbi:helix-turn-helix domain-containing protein [Allobacillus sp. GCM10007491]|uniref:Helix-turn-helix domain-containing protein n=1 Tax=Allobacillus saliphilus TaxID=2912308 RepID=A0A941CT89_9BACI|nr:helix-turn-helix domain-containing protein [Allobacillus saliphilus]MBR7553279.1 helix-turn-helix domain-containing protein [Allobacillus saliphilus]